MKFTLVALLVMFVFSGCNDDGPYVCSNCVGSPEALPANDASGKGIYKGVLIGSSGTLKINIDNTGDGGIAASLVIDGDQINLSTTSEYSGGFQGCFVNAEEEISICVLVFDNGGISVTEVEIPNHPNADIQMIKELSSQIVLAFEGTYSGDASGTLNMVVRLQETGNGLWNGIWREDGEVESQFPGGEIVTGGIYGGSSEVTLTGSSDGDVIKGTWESVTDESSGKWKGKRTL